MDLIVATRFFGSSRWHPRLLKGALALYENRLDVAERLLKAHLKEDPFDVAAMRMLAELAGRIGRLKDAETLLRRAVELAPSFIAARANLALVVSRLGRPAEALELFDLVRFTACGGCTQARVIPGRPRTIGFRAGVKF